LDDLDVDKKIIVNTISKEQDGVSRTGRDKYE